MIPVILSGGTGSRLWPLSRGMYPKQLLTLTDEKHTMLQQTVLRTQGIDQVKSPIVVCNEEHRFMVGEQLHQLDFTDADILLEPVGRNTAPAIALAAFRAAQENLDEMLLIMPADHVIGDVAEFRASVDIARRVAEKGALVTFGIVPLSAETGYGYIKANKSEPADSYQVLEFKEKPTLDVAQGYIDSGDYYWNGGIFVFTAGAYLEQLRVQAPEIYAAAYDAIKGAEPDLDFIRVNRDAFERSPSDSIDYAVMEAADNVCVVPLDVGWSDVGSWSALWEVSDKDGSGNATHGDVVLRDTKNSLVYTESKLVSAVGVDSLIIVETDDAMMVAHQDQSQNVKEVVNQLKSEGRSQVSHHRKVYRPWGWYDSVDAGERFQVKRIQVNPGARLSVQMHHHRAEHWVVVRGTAEVLNGNTTSVLKENESTYIPIGVTHALKNPSATEPLEIIEVQSGAYLGEDDIVRFEDDYGRS